MKTMQIILAGFGLLLVSLSAVAQRQVRDEEYVEAPKLRNDPTYSTRNYKHPNKAATARRWENNPGIEVRPPYAPANRVGSYKNQTPNQIPSGGVTADYGPDERLTNRNYKAQTGRKSTGQTTNVALKRQLANVPDSTTGE